MNSLHWQWKAAHHCVICTSFEALKIMQVLSQINIWCILINMGSPGSISGKELACQCRRSLRCKFNPWVIFPEGKYGNPLQYSCPENPMDRGTWQTTIYRVSKNQT